MNFEFMTIDTPLPPCMPFPRALTGFPVSSTAKVMYCRMLDAMLSKEQEDENGILFVCFPVTAIAAVLSRSPMTVKRSLNELENAGLMIPVTMFMAYFFPKQMFAVSEGLNEVIYSVPLILSVFISSVMPAVCEEALHRGFILKSFQSKWKNKWFLSVLMGIIFGLFHGSIWRFLPTAILGGILTYIMLETENMFYPALFHFTNNFLPSFLLSLSGNSPQTEAASELLAQQGIPVAFLGIYLAMAWVAPFGFYTAGYLLRKGEQGKEQQYIKSNGVLISLVVLTVLPIILGMMIFLYGLFFDANAFFSIM